MARVIDKGLAANVFAKNSTELEKLGNSSSRELALRAERCVAGDSIASCAARCILEKLICSSRSMAIVKMANGARLFLEILACLYIFEFSKLSVVNEDASELGGLKHCRQTAGKRGERDARIGTNGPRETIEGQG